MTAQGRAILLGWGSSIPSQLRAYERVYEQLGLEATSVIPRVLEGLVSTEAYPRALAPLADVLAAEGGARPVLVHLFSDNGFLGWAALLKALAIAPGGRRARDAIRGVAYDSAPGLWAARGPVDFARRFALGLTPPVARAMGRGGHESLPLVTTLLHAGFLGYQLVFRRAVRSMRSAAALVTQEQPSCPHLFLYGEADALVPPGDVRAWIERQRAAGIPLDEIAFPTARHVALYPADPRRYRDAIARFVERGLAPGDRASPGR